MNKIIIKLSKNKINKSYNVYNSHAHRYCTCNATVINQLNHTLSSCGTVCVDCIPLSNINTISDSNKVTSEV